MKTTMLLLLLLVGTTQSMAQTEDSDKKMTHEIGLDATAFVKYFTNFNNTDLFNVAYPAYQFTYRFKTRFGNARFGAGGRYAEEEFVNASFGLNDSTVRKRMNNAINFRVGYEYKTEISKRWQAFYGADFRMGFDYFRDDAVQYTGSYVVGRETKRTTNAIAPFLGFRFKATPRLHLTTEASFPINFITTSTRTYYAALVDFVPFLEDELSDDLKSIQGSFNPPIALIITFDL